MTALPDIALGAVIAALIAGAISLSGLIIGKENKTSEFRQAWIDALRCETAKLIAQAHALDGAIGVQFDDRLAIWEKTKEHWSAFKETAVTIRLRLNPEEDASKEILRKIAELEKLFGESQEGSPPARAPAKGAITRVARELTGQVNEVLRTDWKRVKEGEPRYKIAVWASSLLLVSALAILITNAFLPRRPAQAQPHILLDRPVMVSPVEGGTSKRPAFRLPAPDVGQQGQSDSSSELPMKAKIENTSN